MFIVYVIKSTTTGKTYTGYTGNLEERIKRHNGFLIDNKRSYTRVNKGFWVVVYKETFENKSEAMVREKFLKSHVGRNWLKSKLLAR